MKKRQLFNYSMDINKPVEEPANEDILKQAIFFHQQGNLQGAEKLYRILLNKDPEQPDALNLLGVIESKSGRNGEAVILISKAISINPDIPEYHNNLGKAYDALDELLQAKKCYQNALKINPDLSTAVINLAKTQYKLGELKEATDLLTLLIGNDPDNHDAYMELANMYENSGEFEKAGEIYLNAIENVKTKDTLYYKLARNYRIMGRLDDAKVMYKKSIEINPHLTDAYFGLSTIQKNRELDQDHVDQINSLLLEKGLNDNDLVRLHFALGKIYHDAGLYDQAFKEYEQGNMINSKKHYYSREETENFIDNIIEVFDDKFIQSRQIDKTISEIPVFIVGMPRSGSTLVEQIIGSHPSVATAGELSYFISKTKLIPKFFGLAMSYPHCVKKINNDLFISMAYEYIGILKNELDPVRPGPERITDKQLYNFLHIGLIKILFPEARIIHCCRDPLENCLGIFFSLFVDSHLHSYAYNLHEIGHYYYHYRKLMSHWRGLFPGTFYEVSYDALVNSQEQESRKLIDYIGLEWDENCLEFYKTDRAVLTSSNWQVRQPIYKDALKRVNHYEKYLGPLKDILGI